MRTKAGFALFLLPLTGLLVYGCTVGLKGSIYGVTIEVQECVDPLTGEIDTGPCPEDCTDFIDNDGDDLVDGDDEDCMDSGEVPNDTGNSSDTGD